VTKETDISEETLHALALGKLGAEESARVEQIVMNDPDLAAELALLRGLPVTKQDDPSWTQDTEFGWARLSRAIDAETSAAPVKQNNRFSFKHLQTAAAAAVVSVLAYQFVVVPVFSGNDRGSYVPASAPSANSYEYSATASFAPTTTEIDLRNLLLDIDAEIVRGPSAIGLYQLAFKTEAARNLGIAKLQQRDELVESIQLTQAE